MKRTLTLLLALVLCFSLIAEIGVSASAASVTYYPKYTGSSGSIVDGLRAVGVDSSYSNRSKIAALNGIANYSGTASQNTQMLNLLKQGKLIKSKSGSTPAPAPASAPAAAPAAEPAPTEALPPREALPEPPMEPPAEGPMDPPAALP